ncbi:DUF397 domain-containing protein [Streptomyces sp. LE64]|uniref:DUF397 domain-containing protein n=1 Tax=Streptomyces sp. LE64 TaxID=3448653 RepID=UPI004041A72E
MSTPSPTLRWVKSSYSNNGGYCVEWAPIHAALHGIVPVRDSKNANGPVLAFPTQAFSSFVTGIKTEGLGSA